jgi:hypothetical protein
MIANSSTPRCSEKEWKQLWSLVTVGMVFEVQQWIADSKPTLRPSGKKLSAFRLAIERRMHSMVRVLWETGWQEQEEAESCLGWADCEPISCYLIEAGLPLESTSFFHLWTKGGMEAVSAAIRNGLKVTGDDGWADTFLYSTAAPLLRFFREERERIPGLEMEGVRAMQEAIREGMPRATALLNWVGVDPFAPCPYWSERDHEGAELSTFPAAELSRRNKGVEILSILKLKPTPAQWLSLMEWCVCLRPELLALRADSARIFAMHEERSAEILTDEFVFSLEPLCGDPSRRLEECCVLVDQGVRFRIPVDRLRRVRTDMNRSYHLRPVMEFLNDMWERSPGAAESIRRVFEGSQLRSRVIHYSHPLAVKLGLAQEKCQDLPKKRSRPWKIGTGYYATNGRRQGAYMVIERDVVYSEIWEEPAMKVATRYKISNSMLARICFALQVPRPPRGYWTRDEKSKERVRARNPLRPFKGDGNQFWAIWGSRYRPPPRMLAES